MIEPGHMLRVGRTDMADLVVAHDPQISAIHFTLAWDGATCRFEVGKSAKETLLNGEAATSGEVANGDWIRAGETVFLVYFEGATPRRKRAVAPDRGVAEPALAALRAETANLFAVLDAARDLRILEILRESVEPYRSLYEGEPGEELDEVAPYLVGLPRASRLLEQLVMEGWGKRWGIYLASRDGFDDVRTHLRRFLLVKDDATGKRMYFRFYDPGVLRVFLPTCDVRQTQQLFGEIACFLVEGPSGEVLKRVAPSSTGRSPNAGE